MSSQDYTASQLPSQILLFVCLFSLVYSVGSGCLGAGGGSKPGFGEQSSLELSTYSHSVPHCLSSHFCWHLSWGHSVICSVLGDPSQSLPDGLWPELLENSITEAKPFYFTPHHRYPVSAPIWMLIKTLVLNSPLYSSPVLPLRKISVFSSPFQLQGAKLVSYIGLCVCASINKQTNILVTELYPPLPCLRSILFPSLSSRTASQNEMPDS